MVIPWRFAYTSTLRIPGKASTLIAVPSTAWIVRFERPAPLWRRHRPVPGSLLPSIVMSPPPSIRTLVVRSGSAVAVVRWIVPLTSNAMTSDSDPAMHSPVVAPDARS